jgi:hypothetical protein
MGHTAGPASSGPSHLPMEHFPEPRLGFVIRRAPRLLRAFSPERDFSGRVGLFLSPKSYSLSRPHFFGDRSQRIENLRVVFHQGHGSVGLRGTANDQRLVPWMIHTISKISREDAGTNERQQNARVFAGCAFDGKVWTAGRASLGPGRGHLKRQKQNRKGGTC